MRKSLCTSDESWDKEKVGWDSNLLGNNRLTDRERSRESERELHGESERENV